MLATLLAPLLALTPLAATTDACKRLQRLELPRVEIERAERLAGRFETPEGAQIEAPWSCRVRGVARPTPGSRIVFEVWLPDQWNGRFYQLGNGGFAGAIHHPSLAAETALGNAAALTDTGHVGDSFDARWATEAPERIVDYGHRSIKATSDAAQRLIASYYGRPASRRYFAGCSNGGRQALMAAQRYPEDWDGIVAGAPANRWTAQLTTFAALQQQLRRDPATWIAPAKLPAIQRSALAACPAGTVADGVALDPLRCRFDPGRIVCRGRETDNCLTAAQAQSVRSILRAGYEPASAAAPDNWARWIINPDPFAPSQLTFATQAFRFLLRDRADWEVATFDSNRDAASPFMQRTLDAAAVDLTRFRDRGGRIVSYFGWADAVISPRQHLAYYRSVQRAMGGPVHTQNFYRLFMVPGMTHCQGGVGPTSFGQAPVVAPAGRADAQHDIRRALEEWVERGVAPDRLIAGTRPARDALLRRGRHSRCPVATGLTGRC